MFWEVAEQEDRKGEQDTGGRQIRQLKACLASQYPQIRHKTH